MKEFEKIASYLLLRSSSVRNIGLYHGKMGIVLTLYIYSKCYGAKVYQDFAWDLLQDIYKEVHDGMPIGLEERLAGIGFGITLLRKANLIDADLNCVLSELDSKIMDYDPRRIKDFSYRTGAAGLFDYINLRFSVDTSNISFDRGYLSELNQLIQLNSSKLEKTNFISDLICPIWEIKDYIDQNLGIDNGCSYFIIKNLYDTIFHNK